MRIQLSVSRDDDGAVAIMVALFAVMLIVVAAFTTDFGMAYAQRQALATGADSAALAVVHEKYTSQTVNPTRTCSQLLAEDPTLAAASPPKDAATIALAQVNANAPFNATIPASDVTTTLSCDSTAKVLQVSVKVNRTISPILGSVLGASPMHIDRTAVAALGVVNEVRGLSPIALCTNQANAIVAAHVADAAVPRADRAQLVAAQKVWGSGSQCGAADGSGNWGWLDFGQGNGESALGAMITSSYSGTLTLNPTAPPSYSMDGTPGNRANGNPVHGGMSTIMDKTVTFPVYSTVTGNGANAHYTVIGFLSVKLCGYDITTRGACYDDTVPMASNDMQIRYVDYTPSGQLGKLCDIGAPCAYNAYVTKLLS